MGCGSLQGFQKPFLSSMTRGPMAAIAKSQIRIWSSVAKRGYEWNDLG